MRSSVRAAWREVTLAIVVVYLFKGLGAYFSAYLMTDVGQLVVRDVRDALFGHMLGQSASFFARRSSGQLMSRVTSDVTQIQQAVSETIGDLMREGLALVGYLVLLFYWDARLALVCLTSAPVIVYPLVRLGQKVRRTTRRSQEHLETISHLAAEAFTGHRIVKAFGTEAQEAARFGQASNRLYRTNMKVTSALSALPPVMEFLGGVAMAGVVWYGSQQIAQRLADDRRVHGFVAALFLCYGPAKKLSRVNANLQQAIAAAGRIFEMLDTHTEVHDRPDARPLAPLRERVRLPRRQLPLRRSRSAAHPAQRVVRRAGRPDGRHRRPERRRQDHADQPDSALLRRDRRRHPRSTASTSAT